MSMQIMLRLCTSILLGKMPNSFPWSYSKHFIIVSLILICFLLNQNPSVAQQAYIQSNLPNIKYHLTAKPWQPLNISRETYLDNVEAIAREISKFQNTKGEIIDPYSKSEIQYSTPYFAFSVGTLLSAGRAKDLLPKGIAAMNCATADVAAGAASIPDDHGEFFLAPLANAIPLYTPFVSEAQLQLWSNRMANPIENIIKGHVHNWRTYAMKGEWYRAKYGLINKTKAINWIEDSWINTQKRRLSQDLWNFYHDDSSDPDTWPYESASRGNMMTMIYEGYMGASRNEIFNILQKGTKASLLMQDPSGQGVAGGRSGNHTWNDIVLANGFETMAEMVYAEGNERLAGQYRRAAALGFQSAQRWKRENGTFSVTKNHFNPEERTRYAPYSFFTNYNGYMMFHMAENYLRHKTDIAELPAPNEIGGYTLQSDINLATAVANAGGMQMEVCLKGSSNLNYDLYWTTLGVVRFGRSGWDSRLGPSDGVRETVSNLGVSFAPTFLENGKWVRLASEPDRYEGIFTTEFTHPLLVRCKVVYKPKMGKTGPTFTNQFVITPDGILSTITSTSSNYGVTWPLLTFDGRTTLNTSITPFIASTSFPNGTDQQNFISLHPTPSITSTDGVRRSSYGDLLPIRMVSQAPENITFIYPQGPTDPEAEIVRKSFVLEGGNFSSPLGRVNKNIYIGRTSAGGEGNSIDINNDGIPEATFNTNTGFIFQIKDSVLIALETDTEVTVTIKGQNFTVLPFTPVDVSKAPIKAAETVVASSDDGNVAMNTVDKSLATRWAANGDGQWIRYTLDTTAVVKGAKIAWFKGGERKYRFELQTSMDSVAWTTVIDSSSSGTSATLESYDASLLTAARYVRIIGHGNSKNTWTSIVETEIIFDAPPPLEKVVASSDDGNVAVNTIDNNLSTRWSANGDGQWIRYNLDATAVVKGVRIAWYKGGERKYNFEVQTSLDNEEWTTVINKVSSGTTAAPENYEASAHTYARYIKIICHGNNINYWNSITELDVIFSGPPKEDAVVASSDDGNVAMNTVDKSLATRWAANGDGQWIRYTLDTTAVVKGAKIAWFKGGERKYRFELQTSMDSVAWTTVIDSSSSGTSATLESYDASLLTAARYVRIIGHGNSKNTWTSIVRNRNHF